MSSDGRHDADATLSLVPEMHDSDAGIVGTEEPADKSPEPFNMVGFVNSLLAITPSLQAAGRRVAK